MIGIRTIPVGVAGALLAAAQPALAEPRTTAYQPIIVDPAAERRTIILSGHDLTIDDVIAVARHGAKVRFAPGLAELSQARVDLTEQGNEEGMAIYGRNRGGGALREKPNAPQPGMNSAGSDARHGGLPEIQEEELVRAFLVIQANHFAYGMISGPYMQAMIDLINARVTPAMYSRGTLTEGDLFVFNNYQATLRGRGFAYYKGVRMPAGEALAKAGLKPFTGEMALLTTNAYTNAIALLLVDEGRQALEWADLTLAIDLLGMNSSITPLVPPVQARRPFPWVNWEASKLLEVLRGSYLFEDDKDRILQDPESLRASHIRLGSAWQAWATLRDSVTLQMNSGESNPGQFLDAKPADHWSLATPWLMRNHVRGGPLSHGRSGYVLSNANWDAYPMINDVEAFNLALANMAVTVTQRIERFSDRGPTAFFTGIKPTDVLTPEQYANSPYMSEPFFIYLDIWKEIQMLTQSVPPDASGADFGVADLEGMGRLKGSRGREAVDLFMQLMAYDLITGTYWMDVRRIQNPKRGFGPAGTAALAAVRQALPWQMDNDLRPDVPYPVTIYQLMKAKPARGFLSAVPEMPATPPLPAAR